MTDSSNTSENICAIDWGNISGILQGFRFLEKDVMRASVLACDCLHFVENALIFFNSHAFVVPT